MLLDAFRWIAANQGTFVMALHQHLLMSGAALGFAILTAVPLGILLARRPRAAFYVINGVNALRTIPSLAVLAVMLPFLGIGFMPSVVALVLLAVPPILVNTYVGVREVDPDAIDAATGMGMATADIIRKIEVPLAAPAIFAGIRTAAVQVIAGATLATFIGGGGLGDFIIAGIAIMDMSRLLVGAVPIAALAIGTEILFGGLELLLFGRVRR